MIIIEVILSIFGFFLECVLKGFISLFEVIGFIIPWVLVIWAACYFCGCSAPAKTPVTTYLYEIPKQFVLTPTKTSPEWPSPSEGCPKFRVKVRETLLRNTFSLNDQIDYRNLTSAIKDCSNHNECLASFIKWAPLKYAITCSVR
jgi:hypothetical protein